MVVDKQTVSSIQKGMLVFAAIAPGDTEAVATKMASEVLKLKLWDSKNGQRVVSQQLFQC